MQLKVTTPQAMHIVGRTLAQSLASVANDAPVVIGVEGELGAGKTTLVAGVLAFFGVNGPVRSPTYTLVEPYEIDGRSIYHLDLYRLSAPRELESLAVRDMLRGSAVLLIEWPSRAAEALPPTDVNIDIQYEAAAGGRILTFTANTQWGDKLMRAFVAAKPELVALSP
jgi:tRNA threonylcarbamoyladenosine biosynthesis protein TsaE